MLQIHELSDGQLRELSSFLEPFVRTERKEKIEGVLAERTRSVPVVCEGLFDNGNVNAVMRSAEALGFLELHLIKKFDEFRVANRVTQGADNWLDVKTWNSTPICVSALKERGYKICVTDLDAKTSLQDVDFTHPTAVVFGNEKDGISQEMKELADIRAIIPMAGFTQSFNISVAAALSLYEISRSRTEKLGKNGDLSKEEKSLLRAKYYFNSVSKPQELLQAFLKQYENRLAAG